MKREILDIDIRRFPLQLPRSDGSSRRSLAIHQSQFDGISSANHDRVLARLDELLPTFDTGESKTISPPSNSDLSTADEQSSTTEPAATGREAKSREQTTTVNESSAPDQEPLVVELSPSIAMLLELTVSTSGSEPSRTELVDNALEAFLSSTVGTELDPGQFETTTGIDVTIDCDPVLNRILELVVQGDDHARDSGDVVTTAIAEHIGITDVMRTLEIEAFERYRVIVETLVTNEECPCETPDDVVQAALEAYLDVQQIES